MRVISIAVVVTALCLGLTLASALVSGVAGLLEGGPHEVHLLKSNARFASAGLSLLTFAVGIVAVIICAVAAGIGGDDVRAVAMRALPVVGGCVVGAVVWMLLSVGLLGGGIIPH
jgi:hypothetical protein